MPEQQTSLIPLEAMARVGQETGRSATGEILLKESQRYALAVDDRNPVYFDEEAARAAGYRGLICPPTFLNYAIVRSIPLADLREDGIARGRGGGIPLRVTRTMFGGEEWDFVQPVYVGDTITAVTRLKSLEQKEGGSGPFVLTTMETTFTNQDGDVVARTRQLSIAR